MTGKRRAAAVLSGLVALTGCASTPSAAVVTPVAAAAGAPSPAAARDTAPIVFIEDDYPAALARARATHRPIFVDAWATWCHTCLSMREYVFPDPQIRALRDTFVWLAIDTEKPENAGFMANHAMEAWPTFWVIDPTTQEPALRWIGSATAPELALLLEDAEAGLRKQDGTADAAAAYLRGNQATAAGRPEEAIAAYQTALRTAPPGWPRRARLVEALSTRQWATKDWPACASLAAAELPRLPPGTSRKAVAANGLTCIESLPAGALSGTEGRTIIAEAKRIVADTRDPMLADDRSDLFEALVSALKSAGEKSEARQTAQAWAAFLDREAQKAPTPAARAVFDAHRLDASLELDDAAAAIPVLLTSERDFPRDYNPPARLASAYLALKDYPNALRAIERGLALVYGPRKLRLMSVKASIQAAAGDTAGERDTLTLAVALARSLPLMGSQLRIRADLEKRLHDRQAK